jgi:hypothetical protein
MIEKKPFPPRQYPGVMVSSTFWDLEEHRAKLMNAISGQGLHPVAMEQDAALPAGTVIDSSLDKVRDAAAYVGVISFRYGQVPEDDELNPDRLSLTQLEFREARDIDRPILIFIMGAEHDVKLAAVEVDPIKIRKLDAFREEVKRASEGSTVHRVYKEFNSLQGFEVAATQSVAALRRLLEEQSTPVDDSSRVSADRGSSDGDGIPAPPELYAEPPYIGSHAFVGRAAQLETLTDWAASAEPHPVLLFEAIGGAGKSMLTWEWTIRHATTVRADWAGLFWYSFYEKGAVMADFCRRALGYITGQPLTVLRKKKQPELGELLLRQLQAKPWLLVLDGLERVLVAYHRYDAAQLRDEQAGDRDTIAHRDPSAAIRPEDDELLRQLAAATRSKILVTSRLIPRVLLNPSSQPIPGVRHERLPGLRPADAEALLRHSGVRGDSGQIQDYLQRHCDCHPLVTGVVAGLVNDYLPDRGNFDAWAADPAYGGQLNLADLDLVQKRNHILQTALAALPDPSQQLLSTLALLSEAVDYATLAVLNPHLPSEPEEVPEPDAPEDHLMWELWSDEEKAQEKLHYAAALERRQEYLRARQAWRESPDYAAAPGKLEFSVRDLERRGLLQYEHAGGRWDLHPVVRGVAAGRLRSEDRNRLGQRVVDYFSERPHNPYEQAETLDDLSNGLHLVRTLLQMGRIRAAADAYMGDIANALQFNLNAAAETLSLLRPFFTADWASPSADLRDGDGAHLANYAANAFCMIDQLDQGLILYGTALRPFLKVNHLNNIYAVLHNAGQALEQQNRLARSDEVGRLALASAELNDQPAQLFVARLRRFEGLTLRGQWEDAEAMWHTVDGMGRDWPRYTYLQGDAELQYAQFCFQRGTLTADQLDENEHLAGSGRNRLALRELHALRGHWLLASGEWAAAADACGKAIRVAHESGLTNPGAETQLALARFRLGKLHDPRHEALRLASFRRPHHLTLAELWHAIGESDQAVKHALAAYQWAWADGHPHVRAYLLDRATSLLNILGGKIPKLPAYDPSQDQKLPWEDEVAAALDKRGRR